MMIIKTIYNFIIDISITDIIRLMNRAIISLVENSSFLATPTIAEIAKGNTMLAVMIFI